MLIRLAVRLQALKIASTITVMKKTNKKQLYGINDKDNESKDTLHIEKVTESWKVNKHYANVTLLFVCMRESYTDDTEMIDVAGGEGRC